MRKIKLEFRLSDLSEIDLLVFSELLESFDNLNNLGYDIIEHSEFSYLELDKYNSNTFIPEIRPSFPKISKQSPTVIEIIFGSIGAFWIFIQIVDKVRKWKIDKRMLDLQHDKLEFETQKAYIELMKKRDEVYAKLEKSENKKTIKLMAEKFEKSSLSIEAVEVLEEVDSNKYA